MTPSGLVAYPGGASLSPLVSAESVTSALVYTYASASPFGCEPPVRAHGRLYRRVLQLHLRRSRPFRSRDNRAASASTAPLSGTLVTTYTFDAANRFATSAAGGGITA